MAIFEEKNPAVVLTGIVEELQFLKRLQRVPGLLIPEVRVKQPRPDLLCSIRQFELCIRYEREVVPGKCKRYGANFAEFSDFEVMTLSRASIKERMETWFSEVLHRASCVV